MTTNSKTPIAGTTESRPPGGRMPTKVLTAIESERLSKSRHIAPAALVTFPEDFDNGLEACAMQHLATARYFRRRDMQRYPGLDVSQVVDSSSVANASLTLPTNMNIPNFCHGSSTSLKSKWSAASTRYKKLISKGTCSLKERLISRNTSVKQLGKEVQHEMSAGIAGVAKMIECLNLASK
ncbi:hypothetical protein WN943_009591 [Citrus x changshan-huyou]